MRTANSNHAEQSDRPLADRLRATLYAARGNVEIRERLRSIVEDPNRLDPIVQELGSRHALIRELLSLTGLGDLSRVRAA